MAFGLSLPEWDTHSAFQTPATKTFGTIALLSVDASHLVYANAHPLNVETLTLRIDVRLVIKLDLACSLNFTP